ncbi:uncharacterized protein B0I36DRAFT_356044 [Microdochium trichocladiopsis]|uniref:Uncharacterized protein n=1 Tax=Microdochium trichocladiopsis TaxID=1682393 RepID=A0A9P8XRM7_9PEZI|nr:uncharacterized protein B0I36DRAFT_356044 [Microdochium trichocladiopsis]KAH7012662.1 hypothetical protein B0I36DRAFT_356044 [Microdochium trichocladiopsis]
MDAPEFYAITLGAIPLALILRLIVMAVSKARLCRNGDVRYFLKAPLPVWLSGRSIAPRHEVAIFLAFFAANGLYVAVNSHSSEGAMKRLGSVAIVNLIAASIGAHMNQLVSSCGISPELYLRLHTCIGLTFVVEATSHIVLQIMQGPEIREPLSGIVVSAYPFSDGFSDKVLGRKSSWSNLHRLRAPEKALRSLFHASHSLRPG